MPDTPLPTKLFSDQSPIPNGWRGRCFGCSPANPHGLHMKFWVDGSYCYSRLRIPPDFCGFDGIAHGGIVASVLDEISAWTIGVFAQHACFTQDFIIKYRQAVPTGADIIIRAHMNKQEGNRVTIKAEIFSVDGALLAESDGHWILPSNATIARVSGVPESVVQEMVEQMIGPLRKLQAPSENPH